MPDVTKARVPGREPGKLFEKRLRNWSKRALQEPDIHHRLHVGERRLSSEQERAPIGELFGDEGEMGAELVARERSGGLQRFRREGAAAHGRAILLEGFGHHVADLAEDDGDGGHEKESIRPKAQTVWQTLSLRENGWLRKTPFEDRKSV